METTATYRSATDSTICPTFLPTLPVSGVAHAPESIWLPWNSFEIHSRTPSRSLLSPDSSVIPLASENSYGQSISNSALDSYTQSTDTSDTVHRISDGISESQRCGSGDLNSLGLENTMGPGTLIDLEELEDHDELWKDEKDLQILRVVEREPSQVGQKSSKNALPNRNLPITAPCVGLESYQYKNMGLRPSKTVELLDGDFLMITDIINNDPLSTSDVTLRGHRLQRCSSMNGLLERKLNEVCFFFEVDLDDSRPVHQQSAIDVSVYEVKRLRIVRKTNQIFPLGRHLSLEAFWNPQDAAMEGGLTARWKYSCTFGSAEERWNNNHKERALEFLREDECSKGAGAADEARRFGWRGETIPGGAYIPRLEADSKAADGISSESVVSFTRITPEMESDCAIIDSPHASLVGANSRKRKAGSNYLGLPSTLRKRRADPFENAALRPASGTNSKKSRRCSLHELELTRQDLNQLSVDGLPDDWRDEYPVDLPDVSSSCQSSDALSIPKRMTEYPLLRHNLSPEIDLCSSDLATPPPAGHIPCDPLSAKVSVTRVPGQMLTYGDAFCGGGGATRGAVMAGLRVQWGFDQWDHACSTWQANFPQAKCFKLWSDDFVRTVRGSNNTKPIDVKVDILHLSPPCQYFSPAHTVDCPNDEVNVASLFAVGDIIRVAKPRVVTLEQTFGIVAARFRKYFNSLIQMFTALGFSLRWSVVNLAQWGLPQRRHRLIIIAACPGEFLPVMPSPTHSDSSSDPNILPFSTVNQTLSRVPKDALNHDLNAVVFPGNKYQAPWNGDTILPRAMTTSGGQNYHPTGSRDFTIREYATLQGFPPNHVFAGFSIKKQIGNAVPPCVAKILFESIKVQMDEFDGVVKERETVVID
ncbi:Modification methylase [Hyphodiscus hymeniophilus]|uniref:DNA (cytosine-5-)-methyltransferase n=1 Tax=Hyphodiscus hymeniophilus TaxID=353542 RepID=A0A9P7AZY2_9HELO|nr:Modification methylase [Hyphodiscus hymeniophilus]